MSVHFQNTRPVTLCNHATMFKIRMWILIQYCFISLDLHKISSDPIKFFNPHVFLSPKKNIFGPRFDPESHLDLVALSLYVSLAWNRFSSPFHDLKFFDKCRLFVPPLYLSEASSWLGLGYTYFAGIPQKWYCIHGELVYYIMRPMTWILPITGAITFDLWLVFSPW